MTGFDAVICGAGPAGATAARVLAENGFQVAFVDKAVFPRDKPCGGALRPTIEHFSQLWTRMSAIEVTSCSKVEMYSPSQRYIAHFTTDKKKETLMYQIRRWEFDNLLVNWAREAGAEFYENSKVTAIAPDPNGSAITLTLKSGRTLHGSLVLGAGGVNDTVAKYLRQREKLPYRWQPTDTATLIVKEYHVGEAFIEDAYGPEHTSYMFLSPGTIPGYAWVFPKRDTLNIGYGIFSRYLGQTDIQAVFLQFLTMLKLRGLVPLTLDPEPTRLPRAILPIGGPLKRTCTDRVVVAGDAAGFVSPLSGDGLYFAIDSGTKAAAVMTDALEQEDYSRSALQQYERDCNNAWGNDLKKTARFTHLFQHQVERYIEYLSKDDYLRKHVQKIYTGQALAYGTFRRLLPRLFKDAVLFELARGN